MKSGHRATHKQARHGGRLPARHRARPAKPSVARCRALLTDSTLAGKATRAIGWSFGSTVVSKFSLFGIGIVLARLLGPHAFGTYAVAYIALIAVLNFNELGVSLAIVRWPEDPARILPTVTTISLCCSAAIYGGCFFVAPVYASAMGAPSATGVIRVLALAVLSDAFTNTPAALLQRRFRQGQRAIADQVNVWLGTGVTLIFACLGFGPMSLAIGRLAGCIASAVLLIIFAPESLRLGFDRALAGPLLRFGLPLAGANIITFAVATADQIVVGRALGTVALGFYVLALNIASWPVALFAQPVRAVGPAVFARLRQDSQAVRATFLSATSVLCGVSIPVCLLISGAARPLITVIYGESWLRATAPLTWLAGLAAIQVFFFLAYDLFVVLQRTRFLLTTQVIWLAVLIPALIAGCRAGGVSGAAQVGLAVAGLFILPLYLRELGRTGIRIGDLARQVRVPLAAGALAGLLAIMAGKVAPDDLAALVLASLAAACVVGSLLYRSRGALTDLRRRSVALPHSREGDDGAASEGAAPVAGGSMPSLELATQRLLPHDITGPIPAYRDALSSPGWKPNLHHTSPLYRTTVASKGWDPELAR